jgi:hypothetical protein
MDSNTISKCGHIDMSKMFKLYLSWWKQRRKCRGMYLDGHPFDCSDETIDKYEIKTILFL